MNCTANKKPNKNLKNLKISMKIRFLNQLSSSDLRVSRRS